MEMIGKVSTGSRMDQIYLPKNRSGFPIGNYVIIKHLGETGERERAFEKLYFYGVKKLEPIKLEIIKEIMRIIDNLSNDYENIFITGSFLDEGFQFNDIDIFIVTEGKLDTDAIGRNIKNKIGINRHILFLNNKDFIKGLETDPLYQIILSKCVSKKRFVYKIKKKVNYKMLDIHLIKSKILPSNFDFLNGNEKYNLTRNMIAIYLYLNNNQINGKLIDNKIKKIFGIKDVKELKQNIINKKDFLKKYKLIYKKTFSKILDGIKNDAKQK
ncbi:MAG: hypothetical protein WD876_01220 [Candidatus Pacearchaeota archaeon]